MKHKGYSIIECTALLLIIMIISSITVKLARNYNDLISHVKLKSAAYEIDDIISYAKKYCYNNIQVGEIEIFNEDDDNRIIFQSLDKNTREVHLPEGISFYNISEKNKVIKISNKNIIKGITIQLQSSLNNFIATITVNVAANKIKIRKQ